MRTAAGRTASFILGEKFDVACGEKPRSSADQINALHPGRRRDNDGTIGDTAHQARTSDHNPWVKDGAIGVVTALDITHDPAHAVDTYAMAETVRRNRDRRIKYVISNRRIFSSQLHAWEWHPYTGANPHDHH